VSKPIGYATVTLDDGMGSMDICCIQPKEKNLRQPGCICSSHPEEYRTVALMPLPKKKSRKK